MKRSLIFLVATAFASHIFAGGLVTNTNQSAMFTRFQCRDATIDIDAAYYNPAGLVHMSSGFYLSVNNQTIGQLQLITNEYDRFGDTPREFRGKVIAPVFPAVYAVYRTGKFAISAGINPIGGDGISNFEDGLPSYEREIADALPVMRTKLKEVDNLVSAVTGTDPVYSNITGYSFKMDMNTYSMSMGYQLNIAYPINEYVSVGAGARIVDATRRITAGVTTLVVDVITTDNTYRVAPEDYLRQVATNVDTISTIDKTVLTNAATYMEAKAGMEADIVQKGIGVTPVISLNYSRSLRTNFSFKYEFRTKLELTTTVKDGKDGNGRYRDGDILVADIPAMLSVGVTRRPSNKILIYSGIHYYFDKPVASDGLSGLTIDMLDNNSYEFAIGGEYKLNSDIRVSAGWLFARPGVNSSYQSESRFSLASNTFGTGLGIRISRLIDFNLGGSYTLFKKDSKVMNYTPEDSAEQVSVKEYYDIRKWVISAGVDFLFGENH